MTVSEFVSSVGLEMLALPNPDLEIAGGYVGDLLSWVMGRAETDQVWITIMTNINILAVASLSGVSAVVIAENAEVADDVIAKAQEQGINLLRSDKSAFDIANLLGRELGI